jgi:hypothetical protein
VVDNDRACTPLPPQNLHGKEEVDGSSPLEGFRIASGLISTSQQIGGAIGVAAATTIATTFTNHYVSSHAGSTAFSGPALTHGFSIAFYTLAGTAAVGAVLAAVLIESQPSEAEGEPALEELQVAVASQYTPLCPETTKAGWAA